MKICQPFVHSVEGIQSMLSKRNNQSGFVFANPVLIGSSMFQIMPQSNSVAVLSDISKGQDINSLSGWCKFHSYPLIVIRPNQYEPTVQLPNVLFVSHWLSFYHWILWIDPEKKVSTQYDIQTYLDRDFDIVVGQTPDNNCNTDKVLFRRSEWTEKLLEDWYRTDLSKLGSYISFNFLYAQRDDWKKHIKVVPSIKTHY